MTGTMPNRGAVIITPGTADQVIPAGYHNGAGKVVGDPDLVSANIKAGANIFGVAGKTEVVDTTETTAPASAGDILAGKVAFVNGQKQTGTVPNRTGHVTGQSISRNGTTLRIRPQTGYYPGDSGNSVQYSDPNWVAQNIRQGVSIFGLAGTLAEKKFASGTITADSSGGVNVSGLAFQPEIVILAGTSNVRQWIILKTHVIGTAPASSARNVFYIYTLTDNGEINFDSDNQITSNGFKVKIAGFANKPLAWWAWG